MQSKFIISRSHFNVTTTCIMFLHLSTLCMSRVYPTQEYSPSITAVLLYYFLMCFTMSLPTFMGFGSTRGSLISERGLVNLADEFGDKREDRQEQQQQHQEQDWFQVYLCFVYLLLFSPVIQEHSKNIYENIYENKL